MRFLLVFLVGLVLGCAGDLERSVQGPGAVVEASGVPRAKTRAEADARAELAERGISFTAAAFLDAATVGDLEVVRLFVAGGMPVDVASFGGWTALHLSARNGHLLVVQYLIEQGATVDRSVRDVALRGGHGDVVVYIPRAARAALDSLGISYTDSAFVVAAAVGNLAVVRLFVQAGMSVNARDEDGWTALPLAAGNGHLSVVAFLVGAGADVDANNFGDTALHSAARNGHLDVVEFLVGVGADLEAKDESGRTALHYAARWGHLEVVEFLVGSGAAVDARDEYGYTALHRAAERWGHLDVVEFLVGSGAAVNARTNRGDTALHVAVEWGHLEVVEFLVGAGASVTATNGDGDTPRDRAESCSTASHLTDEWRANCAAAVEYFDSLDDDE